MKNYFEWSLIYKAQLRLNFSWKIHNKETNIKKKLELLKSNSEDLTRARFHPAGKPRRSPPKLLFSPLVNSRRVNYEKIFSEF